MFYICRYCVLLGLAIVSSIQKVLLSILFTITSSQNIKHSCSNLLNIKKYNLSTLLLQKLTSLSKLLNTSGLQPLTHLPMSLSSYLPLTFIVLPAYKQVVSAQMFSTLMFNSDSQITQQILRSSHIVYIETNKQDIPESQT